MTEPMSPPDRVTLIMGSHGVRLWNSTTIDPLKYPDDEQFEYVRAAFAAERPGVGEDIGKGNRDCLSKRRPGEPMFILLGRDPDAHNIVRSWAFRRKAAGGDPEHCEAVYDIADAMQAYAADPANAPASAPPAESYPPVTMFPAPPPSASVEGERSPAQFFFEIGFGACWAEAFVKNGSTPPFPLTDAAIERAWAIAGEAHDDPEEFDRYLALAAAPPIPATCGGEGKIAELEGDLRKARRNATDRLYMLDAVVQMLGPKGREVWNMWQAKGVVRQHTSWGPDAALLTGEEVAQVHLDCEAAPKRLVTDVDAHLAALSPTPVAGGGHD